MSSQFSAFSKTIGGGNNGRYSSIKKEKPLGDQESDINGIEPISSSITNAEIGLSTELNMVPSTGQPTLT